MPLASRERKRTDVKQRILVSFVLVIGLVLCLVNTVYLVHIVDSNTASIRPENEYPKEDSIKEQVMEESASSAIGKERLLKLLDDAGIHNISTESLQQLPTWKQVVQLYGESHRIVGLDTCPAFRESIPPAERLLAVAGIFNSGTNLLAQLLLKNCELSDRKKKTKGGTGVRWQVNWGKHQPPRFRDSHTIDRTIQNNTVIMPVVSVRDPYSWLQSMCRHRYSAHWFHPPHHCPNLIPNQEDYEFLNYAADYKRPKYKKYHHNDPWLVDNVFNTANFNASQTVVPLYVRYKLINTTHTSLAHYWNDWYNEYYLESTFPRLFVRMEDLVFHAQDVVKEVCQCVGGTPFQKFVHVKESAKVGAIHGNDRTTLLEAMIRYGSAAQLNRTRGMTPEDIQYARKVFDANLMNMFGYSHP